MKKFKLTTLLLAIITALTFGLTSCTDEIGSDVTTGEPGYLTINLKTLQPKQTKVGGDSGNDYKKIKDLNIFVFNGLTNTLVLDNFYDYTSAPITEGTKSVDISISSLPANSYVVAVANYGSRMTLTNNITDTNSLVSIPITTVRDFATHGLHMTGQSNIQTSDDGYTYTANVSIAPVEAKITVNWTLTNDVLAYYDVTGIYVVNAINKTTLPIVRDNLFTPATPGPGSWASNATNISPNGFINSISGTKTASTGLASATGRDYNFYTGMLTTDEGLLKDEKTTQMTSNVLDSGYTVFGTPTTSKFHYYVGENYSNNTKPNAGAGALVANATVNANTLVVIRVTPLSTAPDYIKAMEHKYYTYEFNRESTYVDATNLGQNGGNLGTGTIQADGFSVRRKTNYSLTFNLTSLGTADPFVRLRTLKVNVTADPWDNPVISATY